MTQDKNKIQTALRALEVGNEVVKSVEALSPFISYSGDLEQIQNTAEDYKSQIEGVVGAVIDYTAPDLSQMEDELRKQVEATNVQEPNQNSESKYSVSPQTESYIDSLNSLTETYGAILNAVESFYGEEQVDRIMQERIAEPYSAFRDAIKGLLLECIEDNINTKGSREL